MTTPRPVVTVDGLFNKLKQACHEAWHAYTQHAFVKQLGDGSLPEACFRHYLVQDYLFLKHFSRAWALAVFKSDTLVDMRAAAETMAAILHYEMKLHVQYCADWGISEAELERQPEARANMAYTRFVLERGLAGDVLDLHVALAPCVIGYAEIGQLLVADAATKIDGNPYRAWIETYSREALLEAAGKAAQQLDRLAETRLGPGRFASLATTFRQATLLEIGFWDMGLTGAM
jgi:thiaminase/transcriptional activator TenA